MGCASEVDEQKEAIMARKESTTIKQLAERIAKAKGIAPDQAAKLVRGRIRGNFDALATNAVWPELVKAQKANKDGNRYPDMPVATADALFKTMTKGTPLADTLKASRARKPKADAPEAPVEA
jgi:hypothetical protein